MSFLHFPYKGSVRNHARRSNETHLVLIFARVIQYVRHFCAPVLRRKIQKCKMMRLGGIRATENPPTSPPRYPLREMQLFDIL